MKNLAHGFTKAALVGRDRLVRTLVAGGSLDHAVETGRRRHDAVSSRKGLAEPDESGVGNGCEQIACVARLA